MNRRRLLSLSPLILAPAIVQVSRLMKLPYRRKPKAHIIFAKDIKWLAPDHGVLLLSYMFTPGDLIMLSKDNIALDDQESITIEFDHAVVLP